MVENSGSPSDTSTRQTETVDDDDDCFYIALTSTRQRETVDDDDCFYIALFSALDQTHCM